MIRILPPSTKFTRALYIALLSIAGALVLLLITGTIAGLVRPADAQPILRLGKGGTQAPAIDRHEDIRVFSDIGRLRIPLSNSSVLVLSVAFPYLATDIAFTEELAAKLNVFKTIINDYFSALPAERLVRLDEEAAKAEILARFNAELLLGSIPALYFTDMMLLD